MRVLRAQRNKDKMKNNISPTCTLSDMTKVPMAITMFFILPIIKVSFLVTVAHPVTCYL